MGEKKYLIQLETTNGVAWRNLWDILTPILVQGTLQCTKDGIEIHGIANELLVKADLTHFDKYKIDESTVVPPISVDFKRLHSCYLQTKEGDKVALFVDEEGLYGENGINPHLWCEIISAMSSSMIRLDILDLKLEVAELEEVVYDSSIWVPTQALVKVIRAHSKFGDYAQLLTMIHPETAVPVLVIVTQGQYALAKHAIGAVNPNFGEDKVPTISIEKKDVFSLSALLLAMKAANVSKYVKIMLKDQHPLALVFPIGSIGNLQFMVRAHEQRTGLSLSTIGDTVKTMQILPKSDPAEKKEKPKSKRSKRKAEVVAVTTQKNKLVTKKRRMR